MQVTARLLHQVNGSHRGPTASQQRIQTSQPGLNQNGGQAGQSGLHMDLGNQHTEGETTLQWLTNQQGELSNISCFSSLPFPHDMPTLGVHQALESHLAKQVREKIIKREYVNLYYFLVQNNDDGSQAYTVICHALLGRDAKIEFKRPKSKKIDDIEKWTTAMLTLVYVHCQIHPHDCLGMLKYMSDVRYATSQGDGWIKYDEEYRLLISRDASLPGGE